MAFNAAYDDSSRAIRVTQINATQGSIGAMFVSAATTYTTGASTSLFTDINGNLQTREQYAPGYEDNVNNKAVVEHRYSYANATVNNTTTTHKSGAGFVHTVVVGAVSCPTIVFYDNTSAAGTAFFHLGPNSPVNTYFLDVSLSTGITTKAASGADPMVLISYR